jgi:hypothetical protein
MATIPELKAKIAAIDNQLIPLKAAAQEAKIKTNQAQAALDVFYNTPGKLSLSAKINAQNAVKADPNNVQLQQNLATINTRWAKQAAEYGPLLSARDAAFQAQIEANAPVVKLEREAGEYEVEIAKIDPSQATPEAVEYLKETGGLPITPSANPQPGSNTEVTTTPTPVIQNEKPAATGVVATTPTPVIQNEKPAATGVVATTPAPLVQNEKPAATGVVATTPAPLVQNEKPAATGVETAAVAPPQITTTNLVVPTDQNDTTGLDAGDQIPGVPVVKTTITTDDFGNELVLTQPIEVIEPKKTADAYQDEFAGVDEAIAKQKNADAYQDEFAGVDEAIAKQKNADAYQDEFAGVDEAIAQQERIAINTSGLPVRAEDGSVASGVLTNPETGDTYFPGPTGSSKGLQGAKTNAQSEATAQDQANFALKQDWRVRLSLAPNSGYLYNALNVSGILQPLITTNGVVFPYTPNIQVQYSAHYDNYDLTHSNYKIYQYKNSSVDTITISCDFTAQDTAEANYLLAVIHFFKSVTKMFYGQDSIPKIGTPPPLCFLTGLGSFQFDNHPLVITNFAYNLPTDVDYIRASASATTPAGVNKSPAQEPNNTNAISDDRLASSTVAIARGGVTPNPNFSSTTSIQTPSASSRTPTYVPTKMSLVITANPIVTRNDISNRFSLRDYATGKLLQGSKNASVGIW